MAFFRKAEEILALYLPRFLRIAQNYQGHQILLYKNKDSIYSTVYGQHSEKIWDDPIEIVGVVTSHGSFPTAMMLAPTFEQGYLYTTYKEAEVGDLIIFDREDNKSRKFKLESKETVGQTKEVWYKFEIAMTDTSVT